jgi:hypothetical protein
MRLVPQLAAPNRDRLRRYRCVLLSQDEPIREVDGMAGRQTENLEDSYFHRSLHNS